MNVPSYEFLAFTALAAIAINISSGPKWRSYVLLVANVLFVLSFSHDPVQLAPFVGFLLFGFLSVKLVETRKNPALFTFLVVAVVAAFCWLKRYTFLPEMSLLHFAYMTVGMSYVFFRVLHLVIDAFQDALPGRLGPLSYFNYTMNFTALVSGPIQFYQDYHRNESEKPASLGLADMGRALGRIVTGFFKVSCVAPLLSALQTVCVDALLASPSFWERVLCAATMLAAFLVYLYFNFSGYTDVVIGAARFLRIELPENFNKPFTSEGLIGFWGRWHMSLSNWVKTYIYSPLVTVLMRRFPAKGNEAIQSVLAYFVAFFFVGVWHGQTSMFVFLGVMLGLGVSINKLYQVVMIHYITRAKYRALCLQPFYSSVSRGLTFAWFAFSSLWFWSSWPQLGQFVNVLGPFGIVAAAVVLLAVSTLVLALPSLWKRLEALGAAGPRVPALYVRTAWFTALVVLTISVTLVLDAPAPHIVYRAF